MAAIAKQMPAQDIYSQYLIYILKLKQNLVHDNIMRGLGKSFMNTQSFT